MTKVKLSFLNQRQKFPTETCGDCEDVLLYVALIGISFLFSLRGKTSQLPKSGAPAQHQHQVLAGWRPPVTAVTPAQPEAHSDPDWDFPSCNIFASAGDVASFITFVTQFHPAGGNSERLMRFFRAPWLLVTAPLERTMSGNPAKAISMKGHL